VIKNSLRGLGIAGVALVSALTVAACGGTDNHNMPGMAGGNSSAPATAGTATFNDADVAFAQGMIPHHQQAVEMATLAGTRAIDPEIKTLATQIKAAQQPEIDTLDGWLKAWGQPAAAASGHNMPGMSGAMPGMMSDQDMTGLKAATGAAFDKQFATMMIGHHNGAITMARDEQAKGVSPEAKALAGKIINAQQAEVTQLQKITARL
jgi:uncharacterized protein (DUF305 family)